MELGPGRPGEGATSSGKEVAEADYIQRIMRSLTDSSQIAAVPSQSHEKGSGIGSSSYTGFNDSYGRIPEISPGLNPWSYFPPPPELRGLDVDHNSSPRDQPNWRPTSTLGSPQILSPMQREILADFPWLNDELDHWRLINSTTTTTTGAASSSEVISFPRLASSKEESDACTTTSVISAALDQPSDQVAWAQSMLELQGYENSTAPGESLLATTRESSKAQSPSQCFDPAQTFPERSTSVTPANSETPFNSESLSSSLSDGLADLKKRSSKKLDHGDNDDDDDDAAGTTSAPRGKRKREQQLQQHEGDDVRSEDQETKKPINRPRKKGGVKRVREPRYAIKTRTDTEVMDDGYKWRKYGQKAVKNSPHPRNYYRCTTPSCPVRKRVERCFEDPGLVVTTYEGTHTHQSPSFLRGPPGYPGGLQALLATLSHHYALAGNPALPPYHPPHMTAPGFPPLNTSSDLAPYQAPPLWLSQLQSQGSIHENLNLQRAHEQLLRLQQQEAAWASNLKSSEPPAPFAAFPGQGRGPSFSGVSSLSDLSYDSRMSHYDSLTNSSAPDQLGGSQQLNPLDYNSLLSGAGPFPSSALQQQPPFGRRPEVYAECGGAGAGAENFRAAPCSQDSATAGASSDQGGLLEDMFKSTNPPHF